MNVDLSRYEHRLLKTALRNFADLMDHNALVAENEGRKYARDACAEKAALIRALSEKFGSNEGEQIK